MGFRDIFYLNRSDRRIILVLLTAGLLLLVALLWLGGESADPLTSPADTTAVDTSSAKNQFAPSSSAPYDQGLPSPTLFPFDPNTADSTALLRLGLRPWQVRNIYISIGLRAATIAAKKTSPASMDSRKNNGNYILFDPDRLFNSLVDHQT